MEDVEISVEEGGTLKVLQHYDLRVLLVRRQKNDLRRRLVARWWSCNRDPTFRLKGLFVFILICGVIKMPYELFISKTLHNSSVGRPARYTFDQPRMSPFYQLLWNGILFLATITAVSALWLLLPPPLLEMKRTALSWRKEELQSVSGLVQHL